MKNPEYSSKLVSAVVAALVVLAAVSTAFPAQQKVYTLRIQTHFNPEQQSGRLAARFVNDVRLMSNGQLDIQLHYSSSVVKPGDAFNAAASGLLDGDMSAASYLIRDDPAFQFVSDIMGGYDTPYQQYAWYYNGGEELVQKLYNRSGMQMIGWWIPGQEALSSSSPLAGPADLKNWKFRSTTGLQSAIFERMGAEPLSMDFNDIFSALEAKTLDGSDASGLANNTGLGLYNLVRHATYPGFHSMPADHLAINKSKWDSLPANLQHIVQVAMQKLAFQTSLSYQLRDDKAAAELTASGVTLHDWSEEDRRAFREAAQAAWDDFAAESAAAQSLVQSHKAFLRQIRLAP